MTDFTDTKPAGLYEPAIGEKNQDYYVAKFEDFDQQGPGLHASWNWAAFFFSGFWALYRKMYGWFFAWWGLATVAGIFERVQSAGFQQTLAAALVVMWLTFSAFANSLYHAKVKANIAAAQKSSPDILWVSKRLRSNAGVHAWVPIAFGAISVIGIVAAVALPAYQDYTKRNAPVAVAPASSKGFSYEEAAGTPTEKKPPPQLDLSEFTVESQRLLKDKEILRSQGIGGNQENGDVIAWGEAMLSARSINGENLRDGHNFAVMWQRQIILKIKLSPERALFLGYSNVLNFIDQRRKLCRPDMDNQGGIVDLAGGDIQSFPECRTL